MVDRIEIRRLSCRAVIGVHDVEREKPRGLLIDLVLFTDLAVAGKSDRLEDVPDYEALTNRIADLVEGSSFFLLERLAEEIAALCLKEEKVKGVRVTVEKPRAISRAEGVRVVINRGVTE